jgi:hypothetical protein
MNVGWPQAFWLVDSDILNVASTGRNKASTEGKIGIELAFAEFEDNLWGGSVSQAYDHNKCLELHSWKSPNFV